MICFQNILITPKRKPTHTEQSLPLPPFLSLATTKPQNVSVNLPVLDVSYKYNDTRGSLCVWPLSLRMQSSGFIHVVTYYVIPSYG